MKHSFFLALALSLVLAVPASAATFRGGDVVALTAPVMDDLYVSGGQVNIEREVNGDLFVVGGRADVQAPVSGGLHIAAGNVTVTSNVGNDVRIAGGEVVVRGMISGDLLIVGGNITVGSDAVVLGDVFVTGGNVTLRGPVGKNVTVRGGTVLLEGIFHGNVDIRTGHAVVAGPVEGNAILISENLEIGQDASFRGGVDYWSRSREVDFGDSLVTGQTASFHPEYERELQKDRPPLASAIGGFVVFSLLSGLVTILFFSLVTKTFFTDAAKALLRKPWWSLLWGTIFVILTPVVTLILFLTVLGIPLAVLLLSSYLLTLLFATPLTALVTARWIEVTRKAHFNRWTFFGVSMAAFVALKLLNFVPLIGWSVKAVIILFALGALIITKVAKWKKVR
ncbi:MAG: polymer-forming cytoskeletal protein [Candidatus Peribacteraceae bacterium]|jgi:cytoskeletal protein CcmA (bactofilin family)